MTNEPQVVAKVLTVSDSAAAGDREDKSGPGLAAFLAEAGFQVDSVEIVRDGRDAVSSALVRLAGDFHGLIITTGGTGFGPRDQTPEGTRAVLERDAPGMAEAMRLVSPLGRLSRGVAGTLGAALILNVPGSAKGSVECLSAVLDVVPHAIALLVDNEAPHPNAPPSATQSESDLRGSC